MNSELKGPERKKLKMTLGEQELAKTEADTQESSWWTYQLLKERSSAGIVLEKSCGRAIRSSFHSVAIKCFVELRIEHLISVHELFCFLDVSRLGRLCPIRFPWRAISARR